MAHVACASSLEIRISVSHLRVLIAISEDVVVRESDSHCSYFNGGVVYGKLSYLARSAQNFCCRDTAIVSKTNPNSVSLLSWKIPFRLISSWASYDNVNQCQAKLFRNRKNKYA